ncbi:MAG: Crp/Fnr family transcriptional regulator [Cytophagales bacterium]|nr:Crp/Fnr family transcriptional regulator [Cytophagales bacterium]
MNSHPPNSKYWYIRSHQLFNKLDDKDFDELEWVMGFKKCRRNEILYVPDEDNRNVYFVKKGYVKLGSYDEEGNEIILDVLKKDDIFGEISLGESGRNEEFAIALSDDTVLCNFDIKKLEEIFQRRPDLTIRFTKKIGEQQLSISRRFSKILFKDARQRLIEFFRDQVLEAKITKTENIELPNFLTHNDIAGLNGLARQTVTTLLNQFKEENILTIDRKTIFIPDLKRLK